MSDRDPQKLPFRTYLKRRSKRYTPVSIFLTAALVHDEDFAALNSREELEVYLTLHKVGPNGTLLAHTVWNSYVIAKNRRSARLIAASALATSNSQA